MDAPPGGATAAFDRMWADLAPVGRHPGTGGYRRHAWTREDADLREWFAGEAAARGLDLVEDRVGNLWAWWGNPDADGPGVVLGSHLDSVPDGGAFDGPLGIVSAFAALDRVDLSALPRPVGIGRSIHAGQVSVADGTALAAEKLARVLSNDPATGVLRHVDAGYPEADAAAEAGGVRVPMAEG